MGASGVRQFSSFYLKFRVVGLIMSAAPGGTANMPNSGFTGVSTPSQVLTLDLNPVQNHLQRWFEVLLENVNLCSSCSIKIRFSPIQIGQKSDLGL